MGRSIQPPERTRHNVALEASGAIVDTGWQQSFYACFDAFLSAARAVPEILRCCFGHDSDPRMLAWSEALPADEQRRRREFSRRFDAALNAFRTLPLATARHISEHRRGFAQGDVTISDFFGITYVGGPIVQVPSATSRKIDDPNLAFLARPPLRPRWQDFTINGRPLFEECHAYLNDAQALVDEARTIIGQVHGTGRLTTPRRAASAAPTSGRTSRPRE